MVIRVTVKLNSRTSCLDQVGDGLWIARITSPPREGKANEELIALVARHFGCRRADVTIKSGTSGRAKLVEIK